MLGIRNFFVVAADVTITASVTLVTVGLNLPVGASQRLHLRAWVPFNVGASGGIKTQLVLSQTPTDVWASYKIYDTVTPALITGLNNNNNAFANALAVAGNHWLEAEFFVLNGTTAGTVDLQFACNSAAGALVVQRGSYMDAAIA